MNNIMTMDGKYNFAKDLKYNDKFNIWVSYHDENQIEKFNLKDTDNITLFNTANIGYEGKIINHLNRILCEGVCLVYPYLNNKKSDYIGFRHYRRLFDESKIKFDKLDNNWIQYFHSHFPKNYYETYGKNFNINIDYKTPYRNIENHCFFWSMDKCGIMDDMIEFFQTLYPQYLKNERELHKMVWACTFVCKWDLYVELAKFIYDYIKFINDKYDLDFDENKWAKHVYDKFLTYNQIHHPKSPNMMIMKPEEDDGSIWMELTFWGERGWTTCPYEGFTSLINTYENLYRVYSYNIEFLVSVFIYNHKSFLMKNNPFYMIGNHNERNIIPFEEEMTINNII